LIGLAAAIVAIAPIPAQANDGQAVYDKKCGMCHNKIAPKIGDKAAWAPRLKKGTGVMVANTVKGVGKMPPQVGKTGLTEAQVKAAIEYLVARSK
jgi:cytochrome c5